MRDVTQLVESMISAVQVGGADPDHVASSFLDEGDGSPLGYGVRALKDEIAAGNVEASREACEAWMRENMRHLDDQWIELVCDKLRTLGIIQNSVREAVVVPSGGQFRLTIDGTEVANVFTDIVEAAQFAEAAGCEVLGLYEASKKYFDLPASVEKLVDSDPKAATRWIAHNVVKMDPVEFEKKWDWEEAGPSKKGRWVAYPITEAASAEEDDERTDEDSADATVTRTTLAHQVTEGETSHLLVPAGTHVIRESEMPNDTWLVTISESADASIAGEHVIIPTAVLAENNDYDDDDDDSGGDDDDDDDNADSGGDDDEIEESIFRFFTSSGELLSEQRGASQQDALIRVLAEGHSIHDLDLTRTEVDEGGGLANFGDKKAAPFKKKDKQIDEAAAYDLKRVDRGYWLIQQDGKTVGTVSKDGGPGGAFRAKFGSKTWEASSQRAMGSSAAGALKNLIKEVGSAPTDEAESDYTIKKTAQGLTILRAGVPVGYINKEGGHYEAEFMRDSGARGSGSTPDQALADLLASNASIR